MEESYRITISIHVHKDAMYKFMKLAEEFSNVSNERFWCQLGYNSSDLNNQTEKDYLPFELVIFCGTKPVRDRLLKLYQEIAKNQRIYRKSK